ncbi:MAG TPA: EAL domain-containing protein [Thermoanaerobaculia bacterium]|nr:EAL domain-containing protein [Thermoanaerobaculia bacterium]
MSSEGRNRVERAARIAGLRSFRTPSLEAVEQRRLQLWTLTVVLLLAIAVALLVFVFRPDAAPPAWLTPRFAQGGFLTLVVLFCAYAFEKESHLRKLTALLVEERVVTAALTNRVRELSALLEAGRAMNLDLELDEVLDRILRSAVDLLDGRDASIMLAHGEDELSTVHTVGDSGARGARVRLGQAIVGRVAASREPLLIEGRLEHPHYHERPGYTPPDSALSAPLLHRGSLVGVLNLNAREGRTYTEHDLRALSLFAEQAAVAVANAQLFEAQRLIASQTMFQSHHDPLTRLPNRARFLDRLRHALAQRRLGGRLAALLFVDIDDFKRINDSFGHTAGDEVLVAFAERLRTVMRSGDAVGRFGGDEFALLVEGVRSTEEAAMVAEAVLGSLEAPFAVGGMEVRLTASIGISLEGPGGQTAEELLRSSDTALHVAKERGKGRIAVFSQAMHADVLRSLGLEEELHQAVARNELEVHYQPIFDLTANVPVSMEALLRWRHPRRGLLPASSFVSFAEQMGVLEEIDLWALRQACAVGRELGEVIDRRRPLAISINLLPTRLQDPNIVDRIGGVLRECNLSADRLVLEITESAVLGEGEESGRLTALKDLGVRLALDDFGTGYSSLSHLRRFPVHTIKIDRAFTDVLGVNGDQGSLVQAIVKFGQSLGLGVIAEGIESPRQVEVLLGLGCTLGQGFHLCEPLAAADLEGFLRRAAAAGA